MRKTKKKDDWKEGRERKILQNAITENNKKNLNWMEIVGWKNAHDLLQRPICI